MRFLTNGFSRWAGPKRTLLCGLLFVCLWSGDSLAQTAKTRDWNNSQDKLQSAIGLHYGDLGGNGVSFRFPLRWWLYAQVGGGIWHTGDDKKHNVGVQLNYILRQDDRLRLYIGAGVGTFYHSKLVDDSGTTQNWEKDQDWNVGAGVGVEYLLGPRWALQAELDFAHKSKNDSITVIPQVGLHFYW